MLILPKPWYMTLSKLEYGPVWQDARANESVSSQVLTVPKEVKEIMIELVNAVANELESKLNLSSICADTMADASLSMNSEDIEIEADVSNLLFDMVDKLAVSMNSEDIEIEADVSNLLFDMVDKLADEISEASTNCELLNESNGSLRLKPPVVPSRTEFLEFLFTHPLRIKSKMTRSVSLSSRKLVKEENRRNKRKTSLTEDDNLLKYLIKFQKFPIDIRPRSVSYSSFYSVDRTYEHDWLSHPQTDKMPDPTWEIIKERVFPISKSVASIVTLP